MMDEDTLPYCNVCSKFITPASLVYRYYKYDSYVIYSCHDLKRGTKMTRGESPRDLLPTESWHTSTELSSDKKQSSHSLDKKSCLQHVDFSRLLPD